MSFFKYNKFCMSPYFVRYKIEQNISGGNRKYEHNILHKTVTEGVTVWGDRMYITQHFSVLFNDALNCLEYVGVSGS